MELGPLLPFRHSGRFAAHAPVVVSLAGVVLGWPLGFAYGYLMKWIPFVFLNFLITLGYGFALGWATGWLLKRCRVRNVVAAAVLAAGVGAAGNYFQWNGHVHALFEEAPLLILPGGLWRAMQFLYAHGSWALRSGDNVTGPILAVVWAVEASIILWVSVSVGTSLVRSTPYCEKSGNWLDEAKTFETLAAIDAPQELAALKAGDISPLIAARPRAAGSKVYAKLTLKYSPRCEEFFTLLVENVAITTNSKGEVKVEKKALTQDLILPSEMRALVEQFADLKPAAESPDGAAASAAGA